MKVMDLRTGVEIEEDRIGTVNLTDGTGRRHVTVKQPSGEKVNVALVSTNGSIEAQPDWLVEA